ncbi:hypothetical protein CRD60_08050 [Bifidobacterium aemilianum]|uniref:Membrane iron-sulfur containing protein FtrD-like domain-containing protein n=1 Tax=Bifidobacterium aemilianum TaxID=2493120 RepID=A0A366K6B1_9BIFI|nr:DUF2318 domain-containing protein [Bifidobacterium aemilianum]RBP97209.1 hypothetical protein CRD60_08050 [Bifidobacterium aemilianum]
MLEQFITALPGVLGPALLVMAYGVLLAAGQGRNRPRSASWRTWGLVLGLLAALVFAALRATVVINRRTMVNFPTLVACVLVDLLALGLVVCAGRLTKDWQHHRAALNLANAVAGLSIALTVFRALPDVILQLTDFVEPGAPIFTSAMLLRALGFVLGVAAAILIAAIFRSLRTTCPQDAFSLATFLLVALLLIQHGTGLLAIMQTTGSMVLHGWSFRVFIFLFNTNNWLVMAQALVFLIPAVASLVAGFRMPLAGVDASESRKHRAFRRSALVSFLCSLLAIVSVLVTLTFGVAQAHKKPVLSPPESYSLTDSAATIKFSQVDDGHLHRFEYKAKDGTVMRFIIIKKNGGAYGIGLDACENCGPAGYFERDGQIVCKKCDVVINLATIGYKGGCNPIPFDYTTKAGKIVIQTADLDALSSVFKA